MVSDRYVNLGVIFTLILATAPVIAYSEETSMTQSVNKSFKLSELLQNEEERSGSEHDSDFNALEQKKGDNGKVKGAMSGEQVYHEACFVCHAAGVQNAPRFGDKAAWAPLLAEGQEAVTAHGWVGQRGMPPRGGRKDLSLEEFTRAVSYMARAGGGNWKDPDAAMLARIKEEEKKRIGGLKAR